MARRVNMRFVITMAATLGVLGAGMGTVVVYTKLRNRNPEYIKTQADALEKDGLAKLEAKQTKEGLDALKRAAGKFADAADRMSRSHMSGADGMFVHASELYEQISKKALTPDDAVYYFQLSGRLLNQALAENPRNQAVNEKNLDNYYQYARRLPSLSNYAALEEVASKIIKNQDAAQPRLYRADARLVKFKATALQSGTSTTDVKKQIQDIRDDLDKVLALEAQSGYARALEAEMALVTTQLAATDRRVSFLEFVSRGDQEVPAPTDPKEAAARRKANLETYFTGLLEPLRTRVKEPGANTRVTTTLASMLVTEYGMLQELDRVAASVAASVENEAKLNEAIALLENAFGADESRTEVAEMLNGLYRDSGHPEKAEALCRKIIAKSPEAPQAYFRLAAHFQAVNDLPHMIAAFKDVVAHPTIGSGLDAVINSLRQQQAVESVAWYSLDLAVGPETKAEDKAASLKDAAEYTDKMRTSHAAKGQIDLLDGRMQLLNRDFAQAVKTLRSAEASLSGRKELTAWLWRTEKTLMEANLQQNQTGLALECINKALEIRRDDLPMVLQKAQVLLRMAQFEDARSLLEHYLGSKNGEVYANEDRLPGPFVAAAKGVLNQIGLASGRNPGSDVPAPVDSGDILLVAQAEQINGNYEGALKYALSALEKSGSNTPSQNAKAYEIALVCYAQLKRTDEAKKLVAEALTNFPKNTNFEAFKAQLDHLGDPVTPEVQKAIIDSISDEFDRTMAYAAFYERQRQWDDEISLLQKAMTQFGASSSPENREKLGQLQERCFLAALVAASRSEAAKREDYYKTAQAMVTAAELLNFDGMDGKLFRGRLELQKTQGKNGLQFLQQAVAQRPEYYVGHLVLGRAYYQLGELGLEQAATNPSLLRTAENNRNSALDEFRQVIRQAPNNIEARQHAIEILASKNGLDVGYPARTRNQQNSIVQLVAKDDASALKEAQDLVAAGLRFARYDTELLLASERLMADLAQTIDTRENILKQYPDDRENLFRLTLLYRRQSHQLSDVKRRDEALGKGVRLIEAYCQKHPDDLGGAMLLAEMVVEYDRSEAAVTKAFKLYEPFINSQDRLVKYSALVTKAEFCRKLALPASTIDVLVKNHVLAHQETWAEAADLLQEAIKIEPEDTDEADRHLADMYFDEGKMAEAEKEYLRIVAANRSKQDLDSVQRRLVEAELRQEKFADAKPRLEAILSAHPKDVQALILRGYSGLLQGQLQQAEEDLNQVLKIDAGNHEALYHRALVRLRQGRRAEAIQDLEQAVKRDGNAMLPRLVLAQQYVATQQIEAASQAFQEILKSQPGWEEAELAYTAFLKSMVELQVTLPTDSKADMPVAVRRLDPLNRLFEEAAQAYNRQGDRTDKPERWLYLYAYCLQTAGREKDAQGIYEAIFQRAFYTDASGDLDKLRPALFRYGPSEPEIAGVYLGSLLKSKDFTKVVDLATRVIAARQGEITRNPAYCVLFFKRALANQALNKTQDAAADIDGAFECGSAVDTPQKKLGAFLTVLNQALVENAGQMDLLVQRLRARIAKNPDDLVSRLGLVHTLMTMKKTDDALTEVNGVKLPTSDTALRVLFLRESAMVRYQARKYDDAQKDFQELLKLAPEDFESMNNYAYMLADALHQYKDAVKYAQDALKFMNARADDAALMGSSSSIKDTLGWARFQSGEVDAGIKVLQDSLTTQPTVSAFLHVGLACEKAKRTVEAQFYCDEGIKLAKVQGDVESLSQLEALQNRIKPKP